jgi:hypothetical protein
LREKSARLESALSEKNQLIRKLKTLEHRDGSDQSKKVRSRNPLPLSNIVFLIWGARGPFLTSPLPPGVNFTPRCELGLHG